MGHGRALRQTALQTGHDHRPGAVCGICGHTHTPDPSKLLGASPREILALIGAVALRPCTGALFLLILTAQMGIFAWGILGTIAMALGTASVTVAVAAGSVGLRRSLLEGLSDTALRVSRLQPALELLVGLTVAWVAGALALASL